MNKLQLEQMPDEIVAAMEKLHSSNKLKLEQMPDEIVAAMEKLHSSWCDCAVTATPSSRKSPPSS